MYQSNTILTLSAEDARKFFLRKGSYCSIDLPLYFDFQPLLNSISNKIEDKAIAEVLFNHGLPKKQQNNAKEPKNIEGINHRFYQNKDGRYSWRPLQVINPVFYVFLVHDITKEENWKTIKDRFELFSNDHIDCYSLPLLFKANTKDKALAVTNWWHQIEQKSIELSLDFNCFAITDISDCYGTIYTHAIPWSLHNKEDIKNNRMMPKSDQIDYLGDRIDAIIQAMSYGQTNGIPQGSVLMDFIAEMVLGYVDMKLIKRIQKNSRIESDYKILRYRDDYRIFAKSQEDVVVILKLLSEELAELNFKLNTQKTLISSNIIRDSIKPDKVFWNLAKQEETTLQKHLLLIHDLTLKWPNSGSVNKALDQFYSRIYPLSLFKEQDERVLISILVDIAQNNPKSWPVVVSILSKIFSLEPDKKEIEDYVNKIQAKFSETPNVGHLDVWMQRLTYKWLPKKQYDEGLCKIISGESNDILWDVSWLKKDIQDVVRQTSIIDRNILETMDMVIQPSEVELFNNQY